VVEIGLRAKVHVKLLASLHQLADIKAMKTMVTKRTRQTKAGRVDKGNTRAKETVFLAQGAFSVGTFCRSFGVTYDAFTRMSGFSPRAVAHWASGRTPGEPAQKRLTELTRLFDALSEMVDGKAIGEWLRRPNPAFQGSTPLQVIERGETDRIWRMIWELQSGNTG
jgi:hypothetical protein